MTTDRVPVVAALDVGGTSIKGWLVDASGRPVAELAEPTPVGEGPRATVDAVRRAAVALVERGGPYEVVAAGVVVPGIVDAQAGIARYSANIGWRDVPMRALVRADLGLPVVLDHDVRAAALAERVLGAARGVDDCAIVVIGTGIAAVLVMGGREVHGSRGQAGELGHVPVYPGGEACGCGRRGCLEAYASAGAIERRYVRAGRPRSTAKQVAAEVGTDPVAARVWREAVDALATALVTSITLEDPSLIILSGGLAEAGDALLVPVRAAVDAQAGTPMSALVRLSPLRSAAGRLGAAILAWRCRGIDDFTGWAWGRPVEPAPRARPASGVEED